MFLGAEALRGEGGIIFNSKGERFVDELGTRDWVSGEMDKQIKQGNFPIRLVLSEKAGENLKFHVKHYTQRGLMRTVSGKELVEEMGCSEDIVKQQLDTYNKAASGAIKDPFGKNISQLHLLNIHQMLNIMCHLLLLFFISQWVV